MLVVFPIGLWIFSLISDLIFVFGGTVLWKELAFYTMAGGLIGALAAAIPGFIDMFSITDPKIGKIAWNHMLLNLAAVAIFGLDLFLRIILEQDALVPVLLSVAGALILAVSGWLGGELAYVHGVGVREHRYSSQKDRLSREKNKLRGVG
jgi:uncharacterized membrane protein